MTRESAAIGLRVKTGRATALVLAGSPKQPRVLERRALTLHDPDVPYSGQPHHAALELDAKRAAPILERALATVRSAARSELRELVESLAAASHQVRAVGLVVGSLGDPEKVGNPHVRAHAREGQLYWQVLDEAARELGLARSVATEKEIHARAAESLKLRPEALRAALAELGRAAGRPWGAEEKTAALAGWMLLGS